MRPCGRTCPLRGPLLWLPTGELENDDDDDCDCDDDYDDDDDCVMIVWW